MIGQNRNKELLLGWRLNKAIPRSIIIEGEFGSGRLTFAKEIIKILNAVGIIQENGIDDVRNTIENAYTISETTCYIFRDIDDMSIAGSNALLKVIEEPPNNAYFIMTCRSIDNVLGTIKSRSTSIKIQPYTLEQRKTYQNDDFMLRYINTIHEAKTLEYDTIKRAVSSVNVIINGLNAKSGTTILKELNNLQSKPTEEDKIDCELFFRVFKTDLMECNNKIVLDACLRYIPECSKGMKRPSVNKKALLETMFINILEVIKNAEVS